MLNSEWNKDFLEMLLAIDRKETEFLSAQSSDYQELIDGFLALHNESPQHLQTLFSEDRRHILKGNRTADDLDRIRSLHKIRTSFHWFCQMQDGIACNAKNFSFTKLGLRETISDATSKTLSNFEFKETISSNKRREYRFQKNESNSGIRVRTH